ncbi:MAG: heavy metal-binding domain-containing protein [Betaproteobacteria bacterium]|nr:heavy metal-binding domain-containing protein [Betaproteobacteria bacterium]
MDAIILLAITAVLMVVGYLCGSIGQSMHYRDIRMREFALRDILVFNEKAPPARFSGQEFALVSGSVVMSCDYFRQVIAGLKQIVGGRLVSYEAMLDRGRREAILRMKEEARKMGAAVVFNVRLETSNVSMSSGNKGMTCMELVAYGTAWKLAPQDEASIKNA